jgi:tetratricopeptide (TPR) repeat protein
MYSRSTLFSRSIFPLLLGCLWLCAALYSPTLWAQSAQDYVANPLLSKGLTLYNDGRYDEANRSFAEALRHAKSTQRDRTQALKYLAFIALVQNKPEAARGYFIEALKNDSSFELDGALDPPKFVAFFAGVKKDYLARQEIKITDKSPTESTTSDSLTLRFLLYDAFNRTKSIVLFYRVEGTGSYQRAILQASTAQRLKMWQQQQLADRVLGRSERNECQAPSPSALAPIKPQLYTFNVPSLTPPDPSSAYFLEYFVEAQDAQGKTLASLGTSGDPRRSKRTVPTQGGSPKGGNSGAAAPFYQTWWFWTIVGGVVVAGVVTGVVIATSPSGPQPATTGTVLITIIH